MRDGQTTDDHRDPATIPSPDGFEPGEDPSAPRRMRSWRQLMTIVVSAIILMLLIKAFVVQVYRIPSSSMENTLLTGDRVLVNKVVYHLRGIDRGDIVVFSGQGSWGSTTGEPDPLPRATRRCGRWMTCSPTSGCTARRRTTSSG